MKSTLSSLFTSNFTLYWASPAFLLKLARKPGKLSIPAADADASNDVSVAAAGGGGVPSGDGVVVGGGVPVGGGVTVGGGAKTGGVTVAVAPG